MDAKCKLNFLLDADAPETKWFDRQSQKLGHGGKTELFLELIRTAMAAEKKEEK